MSTQFCRICGDSSLTPLWEAEGFMWSRCLACGSDSSSATYEDVAHLYDEFYIHNHHSGHPREYLLKELETNIEWFGHYRKGMPDNTFLDVGHCEGCAMEAMQNKGFAVHGFDVNPAALIPGCTTIAPHFHADLFSRRYSAVLCREVIEHVAGPRQMVEELYRVALPGGVVQIQTPHPTAAPNPIGYQRAHLQLFTPAALLLACREVGFTLIDQHRWDLGFALLLRR